MEKQPEELNQNTKSETQDLVGQQELIYKFSIFEQQMRQIQEQISAIERGIAELANLNVDLDELKGKSEKEILAPIGRGIFAKAKLLSEDLIVDIGAGNFVNKNINQTKVMINKQIRKLEEVYEQLTKAMNELNKEVEKLVGEVRKEPN